jgi:hypothetical protein
MTYIQRSLISGISRNAFGFAIALLPLHASALDFTSDPSRVISGPFYLPSQDQIYGSAEYSFGKTDSDTNNNLAVQKTCSMWG